MYLFDQLDRLPESMDFLATCRVQRKQIFELSLWAMMISSPKDLLISPLWQSPFVIHVRRTRTYDVTVVLLRTNQSLPLIAIISLLQ